MPHDRIRATSSTISAHTVGQCTTASALQHPETARGTETDRERNAMQHKQCCAARASSYAQNRRRAEQRDSAFPAAFPLCRRAPLLYADGDGTMSPTLDFVRARICDNNTPWSDQAAAVECASCVVERRVGRVREGVGDGRAVRTIPFDVCLRRRAPPAVYCRALN